MLCYEVNSLATPPLDLAGPNKMLCFVAWKNPGCKFIIQIPSMSFSHASSAPNTLYLVRDPIHKRRFVKSYSVAPTMHQGLNRNLNPTSPPGPSIFLTCLP